MPIDCLPPDSDAERRILREFEAERALGLENVVQEVDDANVPSGSSDDER
jgi:hypothetical protein